MSKGRVSSHYSHFFPAVSNTLARIPALLDAGQPNLDTTPLIYALSSTKLQSCKQCPGFFALRQGRLRWHEWFVVRVCWAAAWYLVLVSRPPFCCTSGSACPQHKHLRPHHFIISISSFFIVPIQPLRLYSSISRSATPSDLVVMCSICGAAALSPSQAATLFLQVARTVRSWRMLLIPAPWGQAISMFHTRTATRFF